MNKIVIYLFIWIAIMFDLSAPDCDAKDNGVKKGRIIVAVGGFKSGEGTAKIGLCNSGECFRNSEEKAIFNATVPVIAGKANHVFEGIPFGTYAATVYHDENGNGKLDKAAFGKPIELYGFSRSARSLFGRPEYEKAVFVLDKSEMTVNVTVK